MSVFVERKLEWQLTWHEVERGSRGTLRQRIFDNIDEMKAYRRVLFARLEIGEICDITTRERYERIYETEWRKPAWVR